MGFPLNYEITDTLNQSGSQSLYKAILKGKGSKVLIKMLNELILNPKRIHDLRREYDILKSLDHKLVIKALELYEDDKNTALILEDFDGKSLRQFLNEGSLSLIEFTNIAIKLCEAIAYVHQNGIVHKDIRPDNILLSKENESIKLMEFDIASQIPKESILQIGSGIIEANIKYASPEQTGRMNRSVDYRSDIYSLGISFYEMLTGNVPFDSEDPVELVHAHLAVQATPPYLIDNSIPKVLSDIVMKMIEKVPENRYKNLLGIKHDLIRFRDLVLQKADKMEFEIAKKDILDKLVIPEKLYGREIQVKQLLDCFNLCLDGKNQFLIVYGSPGIGKTVLINEVQKSMVRNRGIFIRGKFDQFQRDIPYVAIINAFQTVVDSIVEGSASEIEKWNKRITEELGNNVSLIVEVIPGLKKIVGKTTPVEALPPAESANRFNLVFKKFITLFARGPQPLVLFLDDMQWADIPSLKLLKFILSDWKKSHLMIIGSFRDNEVDNTHPLSQTIGEIEELRKIHRIKLHELSKTDLEEILMDTFYKERIEIIELAALIEKKTKCNPFFIYEFLKNLHKRGLIFFDYTHNAWSWSIEEIKKINITDNVANMIADTVMELSAETRNLCSMASCIGNEFTLNTLAIISEQTVHHTANILWEAIHDGMIIPISKSYRLAYTNAPEAGKTRYKFHHDRVQQACNSLISEKDKSSIHLRIGRLLKTKLSEEQKDNKIFDIANHYNNGISLITDLEELIEIAELNVDAGQKAKKSSAFEPAYRYFKTALSILPEDCWQQYYALSLKASNEAAETAYLSSHDREMERICKVILQNTNTLLDKVKAYTILIQSFGSRNQNDKAVTTSFDILNQLGVRIPKKPGPVHLLKELMVTKWRLRKKTTEELYLLNEMESEKWLSAMSVMSVVTGPAYIYNTNLFMLIVFKMIELSLKYGNNKYTSFAYAIYGIVLAGPLMAYDDVKLYGELSKKLLDKYRTDELKCKVNYVLGTCWHWKHPRKEAARKMFLNIQTGLETGDFLYASYAVNMYLNLKFYTAENLEELEEELIQYCNMLESIKQNIGLGWTNTFMQMISNLRNQDEVKTKLDGVYINEDERIAVMTEGQDNAGICLLYITKTMTSYFLADYDNAYKHSKLAIKQIDAVVGMDLVNGHNFFHGMSAAASQGDGLSRLARLREIKKSIKNQKIWAVHSPQNNITRLELLKAEKCQIQGKYQIAVDHYVNAKEFALEYGNIPEYSMALERHARLLFKTGRERDANKVLLNAYKSYSSWGAEAKLLQLEKEFGSDLFSRSRENRRRTWNKEDIISEEYIDLQSVIKASQALSSQVQVNELLEKTSYIILENAGATKCSVMLNENGTWQHEISRYSIAGKDSQTARQVPLDEINQQDLLLPMSIINRVIDYGKSIILNNPHSNSAFSEDLYLQKFKPHSILSFPFFSKGEIRGVIYLENSLVSGAFNEKREKLLSVISAQIAISLENARLYENLEQKVKERTRKITEQKDLIEKEKQKTDQLLLNILPQEIANELKETGAVKPHRYENVTVMFTDFVGFSSKSEKMDAEELIDLLNTYYSKFDAIVSKHHLEKIKTIGDSYMCASGLPVASPNHALNTVKAALEIQEFIQKINEEKKKSGQNYFECRLGIHSGSVIAGIVGTKKFAYDIWGDDVNIASRMETASESGKVNISGSTYDLIKKHFECRQRGEIEVKNRGHINMYFIERAL